MFDKALIAPCGMNCAICSRYLAFRNQIQKKGCQGCREGEKEWACLKKKCIGSNTIKNNNIEFCFSCTQYPCKKLKAFDRRYVKNYRMSVIENLEKIKRDGIMAFVLEQTEKYKCPKCQDLISIHNQKCFRCQDISKLIEKSV